MATSPTPIAIRTFDPKWCPRLNASQDVTFKTRRAQFGDGFTQVAGNGINAKQSQWSLDFVCDETKAKAIAKFLDDHAGRRSFKWLTPLDETLLFRCDSYKVTAMGKTQVTPAKPAGVEYYSISAVFVQAFAP